MADNNEADILQDFNDPSPSPSMQQRANRFLGDQITASNEPFLESDILVSDEEKQFDVKNPQDAGGYIVYEVRGVDSQGIWEGKRRFNEFFALRECLCLRFLAIPIPFLPEKKFFGNKELDFLKDRQFYLQRFLQKLTRYPYILDSPEFLAFSRPQPGEEIEKTMKNMHAMTTMTKYQRLREITTVDESNYDSHTKDAAMKELAGFKRFIRTITPILETKKVNLKQMCDTRTNTFNGYSTLSQILTRYEDQNMSTYLDFKTNGLIFMHPNNGKMAQELEGLGQTMSNPYIELYHWAKGEVFDLFSVSEVVKQCQEQVSATKSLRAKLQGYKKDLEDIQSGTKTLTTLFKNHSDKTEMANKIDQIERDIEFSTKLQEQMILYVVERIMPIWREEKLTLYKKILASHQLKELQNGYQKSVFFSGVMKTESLLAYSK